jgi:glycosyltransferase involved in cell wall biosynthesis
VRGVQVTLATFARQPGGVWRNMMDLAHALPERGAEVRVAVPGDADDLRERARAAGLAVVSLRDTSGDVWHAHLHDTLDPATAVELLRRKVGSRQSTVVTEHLPRTNATDPGLLDHRRTPGADRLKVTYKRVLLRAADATITVSDAARSFMVTRYGSAAREVVVVHNGFAPPAEISAPPDTRLDGDVLVLAAGALIVQKGMDVLIDAAKGGQGWRVRIIGDGPHLDTLRKRALDAPVELPGWSDRALEEVAAADVFCLPSRWESFGYVVLEAMALGRPVVGSDVDAVPELVEDGVTGLLVAPEDPAALRAALDRLAADPRLRARLGAAGARRARERFGLAPMVDGTLAVYERAIAARRGRRA